MVVLDRFSGDGDPVDWIYRAERYFTFLGFSEEHWLPLPSLYLDGEALEWFRWMFRNKQYFDWNHFKEKLDLRFQKQTSAKSPVIDAHVTSILALLQKMEDKCSLTSQRVLVEGAGISAVIVHSGEIASPLAEENSSPVDNDESIDENPSHMDSPFDEMSTGVFSKEVEDTSSASSFVADLADIQSPKALYEFSHSCSLKVVSEEQLESPIKMLDEEAPGPECSEVQLFDECTARDMSKRYITATSLDHGSSKQTIEFETFDDMYLPEFSLELETINDLYHDNSFLKIENSIQPSNMSSDEILLVVDHGKSTDDFNAHNISLNPNVNSSIVSVHETVMNLCIWDPGIRFNSMAPTGYTCTVNVDPLQLVGSTDMFCFIPYATSTTQVWDPGRQLCITADSQKEGSQSSRDGLHSTTTTSILVPSEDWKALVNCLALPKRAINMAKISKGHKKIVEQSCLQHLQVHSLRQRATKLWFLLLTSPYYELTTEASDKDEDVVAFQAIELWRKFPELDGLQGCKKNFSFRWINHLRLGIKTQMSSPKEEELIVSLHVIFEQRWAQIATQLTETSQNPPVGFFSPAPTVSICHFGFLVVEYVMLGSGCAIGEITGIVMRRKISYFFGERGALYFSESFCPVGWLAIIFGRNVSWFDIQSVLMGYGVWVILFMVSTYITEITPTHLRDAFPIINQLMICCGVSLIILLFSLFSIQNSPKWLTNATHWKVCTTYLQHLRRNTVNISPTTTSVREFIPMLQILSKAKMLDFFQRKYACFLVLGVGLVVLHQIRQFKTATYYAIIFVLVPAKYMSFLSILEGYVNNIIRTGVVSAYGTTDLFMISKWTCQPVAFAPVEVSIPTSSLSLSFVVGFPYSNLEDKVLIEDESIVMNQVQPNVDTNVTQVVIGLTRSIGPRTNNRARLIWDPG